MRFLNTHKEPKFHSKPTKRIFRLKKEKRKIMKASKKIMTKSQWKRNKNKISNKRKIAQGNQVKIRVLCLIDSSLKIFPTIDY